VTKKPSKRPEFPARNSDNDKRRLDPNPDPAVLAVLQSKAHYRGSPKHKQNPRLFGLEPFNGKRGDDTLCDTHAGFGIEDLKGVQALLRRGISAGLVGGRLLWTIADDGWIFEARRTNVVNSEYHGYPVRPTEAIAEPVYKRFAGWATANKDAKAINAAQACAARYGFE